MKYIIILLFAAFPFLSIAQVSSNIVISSSDGTNVTVNIITVVDDNNENIDISNCLPSGSNIPDMNCVVDSNPEVENFTIVIDKPSDYLNGVSTLDMVIINQHIISTNDLDFAHLIPADINQDHKISVLDLIEIRRLILGIDASIPAGSWRFLKEEVAAESNLFNTDDFVLTFNRSEFPINSIQVLALKSGDVNNSAF